MKRRAFGAGLAAAAALPALAQGHGEARAETGFIDRSLAMGGQTYRYQVYVPADYASRKDWPVTLFLHGSGERGIAAVLPVCGWLLPMEEWTAPRDGRCGIAG